MWCGLEFSVNHNRTAPQFCGHMCDAMYKMRFERYEVSIFFKFWTFPTHPKTNFFPLFLAKFLTIELVFSLFWVGFPCQHLIGLLNFFFFLKTRVIKLLIIYLILKINKYINI